ncbi:MAG: hypothetical protein IJR59_00775 [Firmicutes bacterium]|nr:hypothetical protein [Bacillota bacterium]
MKTKLSRLIKFAASIAAITAVTAAVLSAPLTVAADPDPTPNVVGDINSADKGKAAGGNTVCIPKGIILRYMAEDEIWFYPPDMTYNFTIAPIAPPTGTHNSGVAIVAGPADSASITGQPTFSCAEKVKTTTGHEITKYVEVTIDPTKFTKPGIYRYVITDATTTAALYTAGIVRKGDTDSSSYIATRYLDVYVNSKADGTGFEVSNYILHKDNANAYSAGNKSVGFTDTDDNGYDSYRNYASMLKKVVRGSMGDKTHEFPFAIEINNGGEPYHYVKYTIPEGAGRGTRQNYTDVTWTFVEGTTPELTSIKLKHNEALVIRGLTPHASINYTETNDTTETYNVSAEYIKAGTGQGETDQTFRAATDVLPNGTLSLADTATKVSNYETVNSTTNVTKTATPQDIRYCQFINKIDAISPTGIIMRFAPFVILAGFALVLLALSRKTKDNKKTRNI